MYIKPQRNEQGTTAPSLFDGIREKGSREWRTIGDVLRNGRAGAYRVAEMSGSKKLIVRTSAPHHQQLFMLKFRMHRVRHAR